MDRNKIRDIVLPVIAAIMVFCSGLAAYAHTDEYKYKAGHIPADTIINGADCSGLTARQAADKLTKEWNSHKIKVTRDKKQVAEFSLAKMTYDIEPDIEELIGNGFFDVLKKHKETRKADVTIPMKLNENKAFDKKVKAGKFLDIPYKIKTKDAYINMDNTDFKIIKEVYGDNVDKDKVLAAIKKGIPKGRFTLAFDPKKFVDVPEIKEGDQVLQDEIEFDKKYYSQKFVYERFNGEYRITPADIKKMRPVDENGKATVDKKAIEKFVKDTLAWKVNTQYFDRKFKTHSGKTINVSGTYGYVLDKKKEAKKLAEDLEKNKDFTREPVFSMKPYYTGKGKSDLGGDYVEVSISQQTLWLYKGGKVKLATSVTTGRDGNSTEPGAYYFEYKTRHATLTGPDYENDVDYWMPFNGDQGCHDATWRHDFGSSAYHTSGSHGCVNMPYYEAAALYKEVEKGFPVIVY